jgi:hypothetical protein
MCRSPEGVLLRRVSIALLNDTDDSPFRASRPEIF